MLEISCALPPTPVTPDLVRYAEELGYRRAWIYDTPPFQLDVWMSLALAAERTERIGIGPGVLVPSNRHVLTTASAIAHLESLAAGRTAYAFGTGFTARHALGQRPLKWADVAEYIRTVRACLRGETVEIDGAMVAMLHGPGQAPPRPIEPPFLVGASGPKGEAVAREVGDGVLGSSPIAGFGWSVWLAFGTVLDDGEDPEGDRVLRSAGPGAAIAYHAAYQRRRPSFDTLPGSAVWRASIEAVDPSVRHLEIHRGHLTELNRHDRTVMTGSIAAEVSRSGTASHWRDRLAAAAEAGRRRSRFNRRATICAASCGPSSRPRGLIGSLRPVDSAHGLKGSDACHPARVARSRTVSKMRAVAASIICPSTLAAPAPDASASRTAAMTRWACAISSAVGEKTSLAIAIWLGWIAHLPTAPSVAAQVASVR